MLFKIRSSKKEQVNNMKIRHTEALPRFSDYGEPMTKLTNKTLCLRKFGIRTLRVLILLDV